MQVMNWDDLHICLIVAQEGSVTAAAKKLNVHQTTLSRRITALEKNLNAHLFDRSTSGWLVTPVGESVMALAETMAEQAMSIERLVRIDRQELSGKLRVTALDICIQRLLLPGLNEFSRQNPEIDIELIASDETLDLSVHDADVAFRGTNEPPANVLGTHIADFAHAVYASHELYARYLDEPDSVGGITWLGDGTTVPQWMQLSFPKMPVRYRANSLGVAFNMTKQSLGIALLPCGLGDTSARLRRIPIDYSAPSMGFWLLSHIDLRTTARIRIFRDFMLEAIKPYVPLIEGRRERFYENRLAGGLDDKRPAPS